MPKAAGHRRDDLPKMKAQVTASTAKTVVVWREGDLFHARAEAAADEQVCLGVDLFEVIAELAELDLERPDEAAEALALADDARIQLMRGNDAQSEDDYDDELSADGVP
jgi:hypothetical protein